jgi:lactoylglutathione lyase
MFTSAFPILSTPDLERTLRFYRDLLGGVITYRFPPEGPAAYVSVSIGRSEIGLAQDPEAGKGGSEGRFALWVYAEDCDTAVERLRAADVVVVDEPRDQPWGERVARVTDPDGNAVIIGAPPPP